MLPLVKTAKRMKRNYYTKEENEVITDNFKLQERSTLVKTPECLQFLEIQTCSETKQST